MLNVSRLPGTPCVDAVLPDFGSPISLWRYVMMTSSNGRIFRSTGPLCTNGQWRRALMFSLICAWINGWVNIPHAGDLRRHRAHYDVYVMTRDWDHHARTAYCSVKIFEFPYTRIRCDTSYSVMCDSDISAISGMPLLRELSSLYIHTTQRVMFPIRIQIIWLFESCYYLKDIPTKFIQVCIVYWWTYCQNCSYMCVYGGYW